MLRRPVDIATQSGLSESRAHSMPKSQAISWKRLLAEGLAVVASILLAFGIDAWWQDRQIRKEEHEILQGLQEEFLTIHEVLTRHSALHMDSLKSLEEFLSIFDTGASQESAATVETVIRELLTPNTTDISNGTLHALTGVRPTRDAIKQGSTNTTCALGTRNWRSMG